MNRLVTVSISHALTALVVIALVTSLVFLLLHLIPGDPIEVMLGEYATTADRQSLARQLGLDQPLFEQWRRFVFGVFRLDLGNSLATGRPIVGLVFEHFKMTLLLSGAGLLVAVSVGVSLGILAANARQSAWDTLSGVLAVIGMSVPNFVLGPLLILVFGVGLAWLPLGGADSPAAAVLPALTLGLSLAAVLARMTRAAMLDVLQERYILAARARGLSEWSVICHHALPNAALPIITTIGLQFGALLSGAVITEVVFGWPGVGQLLIESIHRRDYPVVQACVLLISVAYIVINNVTELFYHWVDPRLASAS